MGLSFSLLLSAWEEIVNRSFLNWSFNIILSPKNRAVTLRTDSFKTTEVELLPFSRSSSESTRTNNASSRLRDLKPEKMILQRNLSFTDLVQEKEIAGSNDMTGQGEWNQKPVPKLHLPGTAVFSSPRPTSELDAAATKLQKVYKSYRTRRNLADCAVVVEELWWKALDFAELKRNSVSFFDIHKSETAVSRWARAKNRVAKVGKGLSKDENAQKLALRHWLEAIDPRHRYGHNLHMYYDVWFESQSTQPFFYWLDIGDGKEVNFEKCPRSTLHRQCIQYLGPKEREAFEVIVEDGKLMYRQSGELVQTTGGSKWIFVLSTTRALYVGQKKKGNFQHSSFLAGGATTAAGRLVAHGGILEAIWPYSGHYLPTEENFKEFISFLEDNHVDLSNVKRCAYDDEYPSFKVNDEEAKPQEITGPIETSNPQHASVLKEDENDKETTQTMIVDEQENVKVEDADIKAPIYNLARRLSCKWTTGAGPRIGCVRDYPVDMQSRALEQVNLSPRRTPGRLPCYGPIPSPRPSPKVRVSPRLAYMGVPSPRSTVAIAN